MNKFLLLIFISFSTMFSNPIEDKANQEIIPTTKTIENKVITETALNKNLKKDKVKKKTISNIKPSNNKIKEESFFDKQATAFFTLLSSVITLILGYLFNLISQSKKNKQELKLKELEQKHKISEETYQKLFNKRIEIYNELYNMLMVHNNNTLSIGKEDLTEDEHGLAILYTIEEKTVYINFIKEINRYLSSGLFYISEELETILLKIILPLNQITNKIQLDFHIGAIDDTNIEEVVDQLNTDFFKEHSENIKELINLLKEESKEIKLKVNFN